MSKKVSNETKENIILLIIFIIICSILIHISKKEVINDEYMIRHSYPVIVEGWTDNWFTPETVANEVKNQEVADFIRKYCNTYYEAYEVAGCWKILSTKGKLYQEVLYQYTISSKEYNEITTTIFEMQDGIIKQTGEPCLIQGWKKDFKDKNAQEYTIVEFCQYILEEYRKICTFPRKQ